jgi:hypothetical protein
MFVAVRSARSSALRLALVVAAALVLAPSAALAQVFGTWAPAVPYPTDSYNAGAFLIVGEPFGLVGQFRTGIDDNWDVGIQFGVPNFDYGDDAIIGIGGDVKYLIVPEGENLPFDLATDFAFGYQHADNVSLVDFDFGVVGSKTTTTSGGTTLIPYGAIMLAVGHASVDLPEELEDLGIDASDTELDINVRIGLDYPLSQSLEFLSELNLSSRDETLGIAFGLMTKL